MAFVWFIGQHLGRRRVRSGSLDLFQHSLRVVVFIQFRWVHSGAHWWSLGSLGSIKRGMAIIRVRWVSFGRDLVQIICVRWVH